MLLRVINKENKNNFCKNQKFKKQIKINKQVYKIKVIKMSKYKLKIITLLFSLTSFVNKIMILQKLNTYYIKMKKMMLNTIFFL